MKMVHGILSVALAFAAAHGMAQTANGSTPAAAGPARTGTPYRLTYTLTETDSGKKIGIQHYSMVVVEGGRTTLKNGSKVPVATGSYNSGVSTGVPSIGVQTQFTYLDVGINIDSTLSFPAEGKWQVGVKVEQSSVAESVTISGVTEPIVRQSVLQAATQLTLGKPQIVGTVDFTGSTRHLDVEVVMELVK
jgi:hypothetical protein